MTELDPDEVRRLLDVARHRGQPPTRGSIIAADEARKILTDRTPQFVEDWLRLREENERLLALLRAIRADRPTAHSDDLWLRINEALAPSDMADADDRWGHSSSLTDVKSPPMEIVLGPGARELFRGIIEFPPEA